MALAIVAAASVVLVGCTSATTTDSQTAVPTKAFTGGVPEFQGPYATRFTEFYTTATSDFVRTVLQDGQITDAEYAEMAGEFKSCLADQGITFGGFKPDGSFAASAAPSASNTNDVLTQCSKSSGEDSIGALYSYMKRNPENLDEGKIMVACLIRKGVVPQDYSVEEFSQDSTGRFVDFGNLPDDLGQALVSCSSDPLGLLD